jgi:phosphopantetheinyl transferase
VGYWISEQFGPADSLVFPFHVEALYQFCDPLPAGTWLLGRGNVQFMNENQIEAHFDVVDQTGRVVLRIVGWKDIRYKVPHSNFYLCRIRPQTEYLTEPYYQEQTQSLLRRIPPFPKNFLDSSSAIWKRTLAHHMLNQAEREQWYSLPETGPRRTDWLLGRIAAKDAVRQWAEQVLGLQLAPVDIEICTTDLGKPYAYCPLLGDMPLPDLSISHSQGYVVATLALQEQVRIGIDLERRDRQRSDTLLQGAFTPEELALLEPLPEEGEARQLLTLGLWCAKEAAAKTAGVGLGGRPRDWRISSCSPEANKMTVSYGVYTFPVQLWYTQEEVMAVCQVDSSVTPANPTVTL